MRWRREGMDSRTARMQANRRVLLAGLAVSVGLHGWAFAALTLTPADLSRTTGEPERVTVQSPFEQSAIEVVRTLPVLAVAAPERNPETAAQAAEPGLQAAAADGASRGASASTAVRSPDDGAVGEESAPAPTFDELLQTAMGSRPVAVQAQFAAQRPLEGEAPVAAVAVDPHAGHDHVEVEEGSRWGSVWRRMGKTFGFGGDKLCIPIPRSGTGSS